MPVSVTEKAITDSARLNVGCRGFHPRRATEGQRAAAEHGVRVREPQAAAFEDARRAQAAHGLG